MGANDTTNEASELESLNDSNSMEFALEQIVFYRDHSRRSRLQTIQNFAKQRGPGGDDAWMTRRLPVVDER